MPRTDKRYIIRDVAGRPIAIRYERVNESETGDVEFDDERFGRPCTGCGRFVFELAERRGVCQVCRQRECCENCAGHCGVCRRLLCSACRCGFAIGENSIAVCVDCRSMLADRQRVKEEREQLAAQFERQVRQQQLIHQVESLRHTIQQNQLNLQLQAARVGLRFAPPASPPWWKNALIGGLQLIRRSVTRVIGPLVR